VQSTSSSVASAKRGGDAISRSTGVEWLARAGFVSRGVIYAIIGILALKLAMGAGGKTSNQQGALATIAHKAVGLYGALATLVHQSYGPVLLGVVAAGLVAFAVHSISDARYRRI
jgi:hypothetical protein